MASNKLVSLPNAISGTILSEININNSLYGDWSATGPHYQERPCITCQWDGSWRNQLHQRPRKAWVALGISPTEFWKYPSRSMITDDQLKGSAACGRGCCAVLLTVLLKTRDEEKPQYSCISVRDPAPDIHQFVEWKIFLTNDSPFRMGRDQGEAWASTQIDACLMYHPHCEASQPKGHFTPTRLVSIRPGAGIHVALRCRKARYAALSHCWGEEAKWPACRLTSNNYEKHLTDIPWDTLPQTFQDSITFARGLYIDYIWIDSLCIIQNDEADWKAESGSMCDVYSNSHVTLAALVSKDSTEGLFHRRRPIHIYTLPWRSNLYRHLQAIRVLKSTHRQEEPFSNYITRYGQECAPLFSRAWTFQERLVAPRVVFFGKRELVWECFESQSCECRIRRTLTNTPSPDMTAGKTLKAFYGKGSRKTGPYNTRHHLVHEYSPLALTKASDRLPAIAAIAEQISRSNPSDKYLCGLWQSSLPLELLWTLSRTPRQHQDLSLPQSAPSWSWASVAEQVIWFGVPSTKSAEIPKLEVLGHALEYSSKSPFGQVSKGSITLRGLALNCLWEASVDNTGRRLQGTTLRMATSRAEATFFPDYLSYDIRGFKLVGTCIDVLLLNVGIFDYFATGLVLHQSETDGCYHRLGYYRADYEMTRIMKMSREMQKCVIE
ncbi:Fc.00g021240.m01.CDS01 [Cosmosporella sp. VM-42]